MSFSEVISHRGTAGMISNRLKDNTLHRFTNMPANVFHWRTFSEPVELPFRRVNYSYAGAGKGHELIHDLLRKIAPKMHRLNFCIDVDYDVGFSEMYVYEGNECVGHVEYADTGALVLTNARIKQEMLRKGCMKTLSADKAASIIRKYFHGITKREKLEDVGSKVSSAIRSAHTNSLYEQRRAERDIIKRLEERLFNNPHMLREAAKFFEAQGESSMLERYEDAKGTYELVVEAHENQREGAYVYLTTNEFQVYRKDSDRVRTFTRDDMPDKVRGAIGMLKLSEDNSFVADVGYKCEEDKFWITEELVNELAS